MVLVQRGLGIPGSIGTARAAKMSSRASNSLLGPNSISSVTGVVGTRVAPRHAAQHFLQPPFPVSCAPVGMAHTGQSPSSGSIDKSAWFCTWWASCGPAAGAIRAWDSAGALTDDPTDKTNARIFFKPCRIIRSRRDPTRSLYIKADHFCVLLQRLAQRRGRLRANSCRAISHPCRCELAHKLL